MDPRVCKLLVAFVIALGPAAAGIAHAAGELELEVDARDIARRILHAKLTVPVKAGERTFAYPKWIPGEHGPSGPVVNLVGLRMSAAGKPLPWARDPLDLYAFRVKVPSGVDRLEVSFDYVSPGDGGAFSGAVISTPNTGVLSWNHVVLAPAGRPSDAVMVRARLIHPPGWQFGTALPVASVTGDVVDFAPVSLTTLVDSPVNMGRYFKRFELARHGADEPPHTLLVAAESEAALEAPAEFIDGLGRLVAEAQALFGVRHYARYDFLLTLSDPYGWFGLEHHASSDNRVGERTLLDENSRLGFASLLPHEFVHSWNGKFRRPAGLATPDFSTPYRDDLLWVYEGLTEYLGIVLTARTGLATPESTRESLALFFAAQDSRSGRAWRPLADTAVSAPDLYMASSEWRSLRRSTDFYEEGALLWLAVDVQLRTLTNGAKRLDDFCRAFFGPGDVAVSAYGFDDVVTALGRVAPFDWRRFLRERLDGTAPRLPLDGLEASGWRIVMRPDPTAFQAAWDAGGSQRDLRYSLGLLLATGSAGAITDVVPGSPAYLAGLGPGMVLAGVDGRRYSDALLDDALRAATRREGPIELLVHQGDTYRIMHVDYHGGPRYPALERIEDRPDLLSAILEPRVR